MTRAHPDETDEEGLAAVLARHAIVLPDDQVAALQRYCRRLWEINKQLNLTRHTDYEKFAARDLVDSRQLQSRLETGERVLDVGSGGGVPGVVLAIIRPDLEVTLSESVGKKARALAQIVADAGIQAQVHHGRAEDLLGIRSFDTLVVRAVAGLPKLLTWFAPYWGSFDRLLVIKGPSWVEERSQSRQLHLLDDLSLRKVATWPLPGTQSQSVLLEVRPKEQV